MLYKNINKILNMSTKNEKDSIISSFKKFSELSSKEKKANLNKEPELTELPFDDGAMEATVIDGKVDNLLGVLDWDIASATNTDNTFTSLFDFQ